MTECVGMQTILSLAAITEAFEDDVKSGLRKESHRCVVPLFRARGQGVTRLLQHAHACDAGDLPSAGKRAVEVHLHTT